MYIFPTRLQLPEASNQASVPLRYVSTIFECKVVILNFGDAYLSLLASHLV